MLIITGTGRSGTGMLTRLFGGYHEFRVSYLQHKYLSHGHAYPFSRVEDRLAMVLDLHQGIDPDSFVDASNLYIHLLDALWVLYPRVRFILGVRHVRDFVLSAMKRRWHERKPEALMLFPGDRAYTDWANLPPAGRLARLWVQRNSMALETLELFPQEAWTLVRVEQLGAEETARLARHAGISLVSPQAVEAGVNRGANLEGATCSLTKEDERDLDRVAGMLMRRFGYT